ncbi:MAG: hypothetical protein TE42_08785 [Candidatus Synechococcus spongiarum SP3]|uniref:Uncharacterized protein n=1 Tax=Candidatus Synechococcus spongiarum SP3 TaxID=1604020 RepID=A0A0G2J490_9SYNE|nr:MAG: hypothetical protein TE42_08785 [Candidatus Synechococcus spongiarum SP3]
MARSAHTEAEAVLRSTIEAVLDEELEAFLFLELPDCWKCPTLIFRISSFFLNFHQSSSRATPDPVEGIHDRLWRMLGGPADQGHKADAVSTDAPQQARVLMRRPQGNCT